MTFYCGGCPVCGEPISADNPMVGNGCWACYREPAAEPVDWWHLAAIGFGVLVALAGLVAVWFVCGN